MRKRLARCLPGVVFCVVLFGCQDAPVGRSAAKPADNGFASRSLTATIQEHLRQGRYSDAERLARENLAVLEATEDPDSSEAVTALHLVVESMWRNGTACRLDALETAKRALGQTIEQFHSDHPEHATSLIELGRVHWARGEYEEAQRLFARALEIRQRHLGMDDPAVAEVLHDLAEVLRLQFRREESKKLTNARWRSSSVISIGITARPASR